MMRTHVFIVNEYSFPIHLKYLFAGTGASDTDEHIGLLSDINRVRVGDRVIFYLETKESAGIEGGFYGAFRISDNNPLVIHDTSKPTYLEEQLKKKLIYRVLLEPDELYSKGVVEYKALDNLPVYSREILWSLIYRKLKGQRGCTPLALEESERLMDMIRQENNNTRLNYSETDSFSFNYEEQSIMRILNGRNEYEGELNPAPDIFPTIKELYNSNRAYEVHLQSYFTQYAGLGFNRSLDFITGENHNIIWLGNEVKCGVGMRSIDIFTIVNHPRDIREHRIIELKDEYVTPYITRQIFKYVNWSSQYIQGAINANIQPMIVSPKIPEYANGRVKKKKYDSEGNRTIFWESILESFNEFNSRNLAMPILYLEYTIDSNNIEFYQVNY